MLSPSCFQFTIIVILLCFLVTFIVQIGFHSVPHSHEKISQLSNLRTDQSDLAIAASKNKLLPPNDAIPKTIITNNDNSQLKLALVSADVVPNIVKSWRAAKIDWHSLVPKHPGQWERFGTPQGEGKLRLLVSKETLITDYLTRFQESGLAGMYGHDHGDLSSYSGCNVFASSCAIHDKSICDKDEPVSYTHLTLPTICSV